MKKLIACIYIIFYASSLAAQDRQKDSLERLLPGPKADSAQVNLLLSIGRKMRFTEQSNDSAGWYFQEALGLAKKIGYTKGELKANNFIAENYYYAGNEAQALTLCLRNLKKEEALKDTGQQFYECRLACWIYMDIGDDQTALGYATKMRSLVNAGFFRGHDRPLPDELANATMANIYADLNRPDSALMYQFLVYRYAVEEHDEQFLVLAPYWIAGTYANAGKNDSAFYFYHLCIRQASGGSRTELIPAAEMGIAKLFYAEKQLDSAFYYARHSIALDETAGQRTSLIDDYPVFAKLYAAKHQYDSAYTFLQRFISIRDSVLNGKKISESQNLVFNETLHDQQIAQAKKEAEQEYQTRIKFYALTAVILVIAVIAMLMLRNIRARKKANEVLFQQKQEIETQKKNLEDTLSELKSAQSQLIQSEKMASLGELTAGIAHEIQNPLNFVNNFSEVNTELSDELAQEAAKGNIDEIKMIARDIKENSEKINHHGKRADAIVKGMLQHSRSSTGVKEPADINTLADEYIRLSYHGLRAKDILFNATLHTDLDNSIGKINIIPQDIGRVLLNLYNNAFYAVAEKAKVQPDHYQPRVSVSTKKINDKVLLTVMDNGNGIPQKIVDKIFQPFFTTKPSGQGTGLGLSLSYDIVKAHGGEIKVTTKEGAFTAFSVQLPV